VSKDDDDAIAIPLAEITPANLAQLDQNEASVRAWSHGAIGHLRRHMAEPHEGDGPHNVWCADRGFYDQLVSLTRASCA
jgi:hypothetical protein